MGMKEIVTVKVPTVQVGDIVCGTAWRTAADPLRQPDRLADWFPTSLKVASVEQTHEATSTQNATWWLITESMNHGHRAKMGPFGADCELHVVKA